MWMGNWGLLEYIVQCLCIFMAHLRLGQLSGTLNIFHALLLSSSRNKGYTCFKSAQPTMISSSSQDVRRLVLFVCMQETCYKCLLVSQHSSSYQLLCVSNKVWVLVVWGNAFVAFDNPCVTFAKGAKESKSSMPLYTPQLNTSTSSLFHELEILF